MGIARLAAVTIISGFGVVFPWVVAAQVNDETGIKATGPAQTAPTGFDKLTNGFIEQGPPYETLDETTVSVRRRTFNDNRFIFEETEVEADGLGPVFNAQSCRECHQNVVTGGSSQIAEHRAGRRQGNRFVEAAGGSLIHSRAIHADIIERASNADNINALRMSLSTLGDGYVESLSNATLLAIQKAQPPALRGTAVPVPVLEAKGALRIGRFGWKNQHASLESFSADAYLNEMGITSPLLPKENTSNGRSVAAYDHVADPEDDGLDIVAFADFMRATKAPPRGQVTPAARAGETVFNAIGCNVCHTPTLVTAPPGTPINGGAFIVPPALGNKIIHPYSDFLLHDIGTGDGIPLGSSPELVSTANQVRTAPLWGLRTRNRLMHDGDSFTPEDAIRRHGGQAASVKAQYEALDRSKKIWLRAFLDTL